MPECAGSMNKVVLVSINNDREIPVIWPVNLDFSMVILMVLSGDEIPGQCESLATRHLEDLREFPVGKEHGGMTYLGEAKRYSDSSSACPQFGQGLGARLSIGQFVTNDPVLPHLKQVPSGVSWYLIFF